MSDLAEFLAYFHIMDFEHEVTQNEMITHEWKRFLNPREECFRLERTTLTNIAKSVIAVKQMKIYLSASLQSKLSLYLAFSTAVFTKQNVNSNQASVSLIKSEMSRRTLAEKALRIVGPTIARFLAQVEQRKVAAAFRFSDEIVCGFTVNLQTKLECENFLIVNNALGLPQDKIMEQVRARKFQQTYTYLLLRAAAYPKKQTLGKSALTNEVVLKTLQPESSLQLQIVKSLTKPKDFERNQNDTAWVAAKMHQIRQLDSDFVDGYMNSKFNATLPEFVACFHLKQCLIRGKAAGSFDFLHEEMIQEARLSLRSWENIRVRVMQAFAQLRGMELDCSKTLV